MLCAGGDIIKSDRILAIEKDEALAVKAATALEEAGYKVVRAADALDELKKLCEACPELIIVARELSMVNGEDPYLRIRQASYLPIIVLGSQEEAAEMLKLGADAYIARPPSLSELVARVRALLRRKPRYDPPNHNPKLEIERQSKERTEFIDALIHEVKTPLTAILASSELMAVKLSGESSPLSELAQNLNSSAHNLKQRVAELIDFAQMQGAQPVLNLQPIDIHGVVKQVANQISTLLQSKAQKLSFELPGSLPYVEADSERVAQVLLNLLTNASKFSPANTNISLRVYPMDAFLTVEVVDCAPPINPREAELLFTPYYRSEQAKRTCGFGLGLSICKRLVELQGGKIWVHSQDEGNTFGFSLPLVASQKPWRESSVQGEVKNENPTD